MKISLGPDIWSSQ